MTRVVIVGGGPGGYEAALVAAQLGAQVTVVDRDGLGGSAVLTDCVPSKALVATADVAAEVRDSRELGVRPGDDIGVDITTVDDRIRALARSQSDDVARQLAAENIRVIRGVGRLDGPDAVIAEPLGPPAGPSADPSTTGPSTTGPSTTGPSGAGPSTAPERLPADIILIATGAHPRILPEAVPDGERILTWTQMYDLAEPPERLIVVGSGVTGAEFAGAYNGLGCDVVLVSSRDRVLPTEDADAATVIEDVFRRRGMSVLSRSRAARVERRGDGVLVTLTDGRTVEGSHCLLAVGSVPNTDAIGLDKAGVAVDERGFVTVDRVSRTTARGVYAAGDCTGVLMLASVAAMQGRIAMWHALGDAVTPLDLDTVSATVFTSPEIATVGWSQADIDSGRVQAVGVKLPLAGNPRAKMQGIRDGFVKLFCRPGTGIVVGGVVVAPRASELVHPLSLAVRENLTVDQLAHGFTVYPSLSGSLAEAARRLHLRDQPSGGARPV